MHLCIVFHEALQVGLLKHLGYVATVLLDLVCLRFFMSFQTDWMMMMIRSDLCVEHWLLSDIHWIITINGKINVWKCKLIFPTDTLQQKIEKNDLNPYFFSWLKLLHSTVYIYIYIGGINYPIIYAMLVG